ncbi:MAG: NAD(P)H-hydrate dehydratase [Firmicutes bacterium]|nr:NAD(P)H-hydrate dehydratase [Bacillota bacterium]
MQDLYYYEVNKDLNKVQFFERFPKRPADANKGTFGKILLISGSLGMAGAACLNIIGAKALGAQYINVALPESIYNICATRFLTPVYYPYRESAADDLHSDPESTISILLPNMRAVCFGSGAVNNFYKTAVFNVLYEKCKAPLVLDAEALKLLKWSGNELGPFDCPLILTPHWGEFSTLANVPLAKIKEDPVRCAAEYASQNNVIMVLKGPETVVAAPDGRYYKNRTGNQGLAQAGSGDVLAGMITAMLSFMQDPFEAACMAVFAHGMAADELAKEHSMQLLPLEKIPEVMDKLFFEKGF